MEPAALGSDTGNAFAPESARGRKEVPGLRIVSDELWEDAKPRQERGRHAVRAAGNPAGARRPQYLFSGLTKCGLCGAGFIMTGKHRLGCFGARDQGRCDNHLTIRRDEVEARVLKALQEKLLNQELFDEFCQEFTREMNRLRMERRAGLSSGKREVERIGTRIKKLLNLMLDKGIAVDEGKAEIKALDARRRELQAHLESADEPPPLLHPRDGRAVPPEGDDARSCPGGRRNAYRGEGGASRPDRRHHLDAGDEHPQNRTEGESRGDAWRDRTKQKVPGNRRPFAASIDGCGGVQPAVPAAVERGGVGGKALVTGRSEHAPPTCRSMGTAKAPSGAESIHFVDTRAVSSSAQLSVTWI